PTAPAADAIAAWKVLETTASERPNMESSYYLCCGTKPHSLALALRAICIQHPTVLYSAPEKHNFVDVYRAGVYWNFRIQDVSVLPRAARQLEDHENVLV